MDLFYPRTLAHPEQDGVWCEKAWHFQHRVIKLKDKRTVRDNVEERIQVYQEGDEEIQITTHRKYYTPKENTQMLKATGFQEVLLSAAYEIRGFRETLSEFKLSDHFLVKAVKKS